MSKPAARFGRSVRALVSIKIDVVKVIFLLFHKFDIFKLQETKKIELLIFKFTYKFNTRELRSTNSHRKTNQQHIRLS
jgi:hypothetical protein